MRTQRLNRREPRRHAGVVVVFVSLAAFSSHAASFHVANTLDSGASSLRWAISNANAAVGADMIIGTNLLGTITLESPLPAIIGTATIAGPGASLLTISGSNRFRIFEIVSGSTVAISGVTIAEGYVTNGGGAGILNAGSLTLAGCAVVRNWSVSVPGGGILNRGTLMVVSSALVSNIAGGAGAPFGLLSTADDLRGRGGGIYLQSGAVTISNSTVAANRAIGSWACPPRSGGGLGGGVFAEGGQLTLARSTLSGNAAIGGYGGNDCIIGFVGYPGANGFGGAICLPTNAPATLVMVNCTLSGNRSQGGDGGGGAHYGGDGGNAYGGGMFCGANSVSLVNCTIYQNVAAGGAGGPGGTQFPYHGGYSGSAFGAGIYSPLGGLSLLNNILQSSYGSFNSQGYNLVDSGFGMSGLVASDRTNASFSLGVLDDYGGVTLTHAPFAESPAVDAGTSSGAPQIDQRGMARPQSLGVDIGAVELSASSPLIRNISTNQSVVAGTNVSLSVSVFGALPLIVQWQKNDIPLMGQTNMTLAINGVRPEDSGNYAVAVRNSFGSITSAPVVLTVVPIPPSIVRQPHDQYVTLNAQAVFCVHAVGGQPLCYQWRRDEAPIPGATSPRLSIEAVVLTNVGNYSVVVTNDYGAVTSQVASLVLFTLPPSRRVVAWGDNTAGQTSLPSGLSNVTDIVAGGLLNAVRKSDGTITLWGGSGFCDLTNSPSDLTNIAAISVSDTHVLAVRSNGTVLAWGSNSFGQTNVPTGLTGVVAVASGFCHSMALTGDGQVVVWGSSQSCGDGTTNVPANLGRVVAIAAGDGHCLALKAGGTVAAWGGGYFGQTNVPPGLSNVVAISAGSYHSAALRNDGMVFTWGSFLENANAPVGECGFQAVSGGHRFNLGLLRDGTVVGWGTNIDDRGQFDVPAGLIGVTKIAAGSSHSLALGILPTLASPVVTAFSEDEVGVSGRSLTLGVSAFGAKPISYQWYQDGKLIRRGTNATLNIRTVTDSAAGQYLVVLSNSFGIVTGGVALVTVYHPLNITDSGGGIVTTMPEGDAFPSNAAVSLTATSLPGWVFLQWLGDVMGTNPSASLLMNRARCVEAVFGTTLSNVVSGAGALVVEPSPVLYPYGSTVRLTALPQTGNYFAFWGTAASGTNNPLSFAVTNANSTVTAMFQPLTGGEFALAVLAEGFGSVSNTPRGNRFNSGQTITLTAVPEPGQSFFNWSGDAIGTQNPLTLTMNQSRLIIAHFTKRPSLALQLCSERSLDGFQFVLTGEFGMRYELQKNDDWQGWLPLGTVTNAFGTSQFNDKSATNAARRVYRAVLAP